LNGHVSYAVSLIPIFSITTRSSVLCSADLPKKTTKKKKKKEKKTPQHVYFVMVSTAIV
jgi:hypothetical protein